MLGKIYLFWRVVFATILPNQQQVSQAFFHKPVFVVAKLAANSFQIHRMLNDEGVVRQAQSNVINRPEERPTVLVTAESIDDPEECSLLSLSDSRLLLCGALHILQVN